jgi:hypothetical protein
LPQIAPFVAINNLLAGLGSRRGGGGGGGGGGSQQLTALVERRGTVTGNLLQPNTSGTEFSARNGLGT